ncbi:unnamed protein product [Sphagnum jensenii]|uniref:Uncharacterized protein n=1 Tax=Sphagnum jensenii TaxID=128206 RepID=A0ABP0V712_9BRYO
MRSVPMEAESKQAGRPIFKDVPYLRITFPSDRTKTWDQPVKMEGSNGAPSDIERFPRQWEKFKREEEQVPDGTPLTEFPALGRSRVLELKAMNIHTVEQYAQIPDGNIASLGLGARKEQQICRAYLDRAVNLAQVTRLENENEMLKADMEMLQQQMKDLARSVQQDSKNKAKGAA